MEVVVERCAGLDVSKDEIVACVRVPDNQGGRPKQTRSFPSFSDDLEQMASWLQEHSA